MKRANGEGSVYKDGDKFRAVLAVPNPEYGRVRGASRTKRISWICPTKPAARQKLKEERARRDSGQLALSGKQTLGSYLTTWLEEHRTHLRDTSYDAYRQHIKRITLHIGDVRLAQLKPWHVDHPCAEMQRVKLSVNTIRTVRHVLGKALSDAVRWELIPSNPVDRSLPPKAPKRPVRALTKEQVAALLDAAEGTDLYPLWLLFVSIGIRHGEALGLRWTDLQGHSLTISQQLQEPLGGGHVLVDLKSDASHRTVTLPPAVVRALAAHRARQNEKQLQAGPAWRNTHKLMFCRDDGSPWRQHEIRTNFQTVLETAGIARARVHDLRHTAATHMLGQGTDYKTVQGRLGHSTASTTLDIYGEVLATMDQEAADRMNQFLEDIS